MAAAARSLSRFAASRSAIASRRYALAISKPHDRHDNVASLVNPWKITRRGPDLFSLVCVPVDEKTGTHFDGVSDEHFASAVSSAADGQMWFDGGNILFTLPTQQKDGQPRGAADATKLRVGASVVVDVDLYGAGFYNAAILAMTGNEIINFNANPLQAYATVEKIGADGGVDVL
eukprot:4898182-Prymnesium_polylepis.1